jgi:hypothetical protein
MPSAANPNPYLDVQSSFRAMQDYFSNRGTTPKTPKGYVRPYVESTPSTPLPLKYRSPHGESAPNTTLPRRSQCQFRESTPMCPIYRKSKGPYITNTAKGAHPQNRLLLGGSFRQKPSEATEAVSPLPIHRKVAGSPPHRREASTETIVHNASTTGSLPTCTELPGSFTLPMSAPGLDVTMPGDAKPTPSLASSTTPKNPFLGISQDLTDPGGLRGDSATVTSYPSATTSPAQSPHPSGQSLKDIIHGVRFASLKELPPVVLKDPVAARIPPSLGSLEVPISAVQRMRGYLPIRRGIFRGLSLGDLERRKLTFYREPCLHKHTHHHHYWVRTPSRPARRQQRHEGSSSEGKPETGHKQDPKSKLPLEKEAQRFAEYRVPNESSRHRYIIGTPPTSDTNSIYVSTSKIMSNSFVRARKWGAEEHTHIHIYVPTYAECRTAPEVISERSPDSISAHKTAEVGQRSDSKKHVVIPSQKEREGGRGISGTPDSSPGPRTRRHRRSFLW